MIGPHGADALKPLHVAEGRYRSELLAEAESLPSVVLNSAAAANAVMLGGGYFTPLDGFMNLADALSVAETMQTAGGLFWPVPILNLCADVGDHRDGATHRAARSEHARRTGTCSDGREKYRSDRR